MLKVPALVAMLLLASAVHADDSAPPAITVQQAHATVDAVAAKIAKVYVFPEKRAAIVAALRAKEASGRYDLTSPAQLSAALSEDMHAASNDHHMYIGWDPAQYAGFKAAPVGAASNNVIRAEAARGNQGFAELRILPGNLRYVRWSQVFWDKQATPKVMADAARFLSGGDAIIIDMRGNGGGDADAVKTFVSYFMPPKDRVLMTFHDGLTGKTSSTHVLTKLPAPRLTGKPLYVLIDGNTGSAAEEFVYHIQQFKLGTLIGSHSAGAANNNTLYAIDPGFVLSVSTGHPEHPVSHSNWESSGVIPDVASAPAKALDIAQAMALKDRIAHGDTTHRAEYQWALPTAEAKANPPKLEAASLDAFAGNYDGARKIWLENGTLMYRRESRDAQILAPLAADFFALGDGADVRLRFHRADGKITGFDLLYQDGESVAVGRAG